MTEDPDHPDRDDELPSRPWTRPLVLAIPLALAAGAGVLLYLRCDARHGFEVARGQPEGALVVRGEHGATLVVVDRVGKSPATYRLLALDPATGAQIHQRVIEESAHCWPASPGRMWCADGEGHTHLVGVPGFEAATASDADAASRTWLGHPDAGCSYKDSLALGADHLTFGTGTQRRPLVRHSPHDEGREPVTYSLPGTAEFLAPSFLETDDPTLLLVQHDAALDRPGDTQLTRVGEDLHAQWTADLPARCETAHVVGDKLVITTSDPTVRALAFDLTTGKLAWRFAFSP